MHVLFPILFSFVLLIIFVTLLTPVHYRGAPGLDSITGASAVPGLWLRGGAIGGFLFTYVRLIFKIYLRSGDEWVCEQLLWLEEFWCFEVESTNLNSVVRNGEDVMDGLVPEIEAAFTLLTLGEHMKSK